MRGTSTPAVIATAAPGQDTSIVLTQKPLSSKFVALSVPLTFLPADVPVTWPSTRNSSSGTSPSCSCSGGCRNVLSHESSRSFESEQPSASAPGVSPAFSLSMKPCSTTLAPAPVPLGDDGFVVGVVDLRGVVFCVDGLADVLDAGGAAVLFSSFDRKKPGATGPGGPAAAGGAAAAPGASRDPGGF